MADHMVRVFDPRYYSFEVTCNAVFNVRRDSYRFSGCTV